MDTLEAIRLRRSVKPENMRPDPIPEETLNQLFEAANWAPSHRLTEPWRFMVFQGEKKLELATMIGRAMTDGVDLSADDPRLQKLQAKMNGANVVVAVICQTSDSEKIFEHEEIASTAMAVQNMHLAARASGIAGFWSSGKKAFSPIMAEYLGISSPARCLGFFYLGYPKEGWPEGKRGPVSDKFLPVPEKLPPATNA